MRTAEDPKCKNCTHRILISVYRTFSDELKHEQYYVCVLSYCPFEERDVVLDSILKQVR
jgi:hypothetical protein